MIKFEEMIRKIESFYIHFLSDLFYKGVKFTLLSSSATRLSESVYLGMFNPFEQYDQTKMRNVLEDVSNWLRK